MRHLQALEMRKRQRQRASSAPREPRISRDELAKRAATRRAASPLGAVASVVVASPANGTKASPKPMVLPPPRGMVVVASPVRRTAAEIRAACARLSDHVMHTFGEKYLLNMRTTCASRYSSKITTIMRLQHVTAQLASKRESVSKLTMAGSELLASIVGCPTETVGELLPGSKLTKDNMANDSFVSACVRRRILLSHPDCWLPLNVDGYAELTVQLLETGANVRLYVRPTAKTELVYCCHPNARICVLNKSAATLEKRVRAGFVDHIREDGQSMVVFDGTDAAVAMDLRSPLVVSQAESLHRTAVKLSVEGTQVKLNLDIVLRPPQHVHVPTKLARKSTKSPQKSKHPSPARPASVPSLIIPLSAGHNRQPSPSEASEAGGQGEMEPGGGADQTAASEAERLAEGKTAEPSDGSSMQVAAISAEGEALALKLAQSQSDAPQSSDMQIIPLPSPIQSVSCKTLFDQLIRSFQGH